MPEPITVTEGELAVVIQLTMELRQLASEYDRTAGEARSEAAAVHLAQQGQRARARANTLLGLIDKLERCLEG